MFNGIEVNKVILITIDALRADHLGCLGYSKKEISTDIDMIAKKSYLFTHAFANGPGTPSSFSSLFSSTYPLMYGGYEKFNSSRPSIQSLLLQNGIKTAGIHSNPYLSKYYGYNRGFLYFYDSFNGEEPSHTFINMVKKRIKKFAFKNTNLRRMGRKIYSRLLGVPKPYMDAKKTTNKALEWIKMHKDYNFFLWIHYMDTHEPFYPPSKFIENRITNNEIKKLNKLYMKSQYHPKIKLKRDEINKIIELYDGEIKYVSYWIGNLLEKLEVYGILDDCMIIITADHGEEFLDHGDVGHPPKLYNELLHVPLIIYLPQKRGNVVNFPVELMDVAPTIANIFNLEDKNFMGSNIFNKIKNKKLKPIISEVSNPRGSSKIDKKYLKISCIFGKWKYIFGQGSEELYDLERDPHEQVNLIHTYPKLRNILRSIIVKHKGLLNCL